MTSNPTLSAGPESWPSKRLILCPQDKGGIGKSFIMTLLYDYLIDHEVTVRAFDLDHANSTLRRFVEIPCINNYLVAFPGCQPWLCTEGN
ncbi:hypothetical protein [Geminisphaera colitermitum]|uniref:hypothetical protein n=1 Tax=Geminisphaera colitermitum TaxID=1148786 RepID=UPI0001964D6D|nr:hypothetical protein [Geminisphaera colitermitum]